MIISICTYIILTLKNKVGHITGPCEHMILSFTWISCLIGRENMAIWTLSYYLGLDSLVSRMALFQPPSPSPTTLIGLLCSPILHSRFVNV